MTVPVRSKRINKLKQTMLRRKPRSLFSTKTFKVGLISYLTGLAPLIIECLYDKRFITPEEATVITGLTSTFAFLLVGRTTTAPVWTPDSMPGPNKSDLEFGSRSL